MAKQRRSAPRGSYLPIILMAVTVLGMLGLSFVAVAWSLGYFEDTPKQQAETVDRTGKLAFPALARPVAAYEKLSKDDFINPRTNQLNVVWLPEATADVASRNMSEILGRVLSRDKQVGLVLTEADFMEEGTRPGLVAGIPAGKYAVSMPASGIPGLEQLRNGDRFDLLVSLPKREGEAQLSNSEPAALFGGIKPASLRVGQLSRRHGVKHLVTNGMLVALFRGDKRSTTGASGLTVKPTNSRSNAKTSGTVFAELAVEPDEIGALTEAVSSGTAMTCVLRSGLPSSKTDGVVSTEGMIPVITTATPVDAFTALSDENLMDDATGKLHLYYFSADKVSDQWLTDPAEVYGRVLARPLRRGSLITESDLLPVGTRPGISAGLPPGMAGMSLFKTNVQGFENLSVGDRFSILTRVPGEVAATAPTTTWATLQGGQLSDDDERIAEMVRTGIREVVHEAIYLSDGGGENVIIGVSEMEVAKLAQLIRDKAEVFAVARSTQDDFDSASTVRQRHRVALQSKRHDAMSEAPAALSKSPKPAFRLVAQNQPAQNQQAQNLPAQNPTGIVYENTPQLSGKASVPILVKDVPAFEELAIEDFVDPATGRIRTLFFDAADIDATWETDIRKLIDRVAMRPLRAGRPVRQQDVSPPGTPSGPAIGLEPGMRAVTVNAAQIAGLEGTPVGTVFDLVSARGLEVSGLADTVRPSISSADAVKEAGKLPGGRVASSRTIAARVKLLSNAGVTQVLVARSSGGGETQKQTRLTADGSTVTETVKSDPLAFEEQTVKQFVLAVPAGAVGSVLGLLDTQNPLQVVILPLSEGNGRDLPGNGVGDAEPPVRAIIQEHVRGTAVETEVFLTDRPAPLAVISSGTNWNAGGTPQ